ncbi:MULTISPECIES: hypothetical protein [Paenibacillus]|uniref:hypothetical protein n=1 Tax=Paenibacillus TaxID=44249 RepID=UPI0003E27A7A|nr:MULTISPECIES: hypothetical protein [Paenibacillus]ETT30980.1 hypothetical protein C169_27120 [Paenibacillus sp. FSL R5-808]MDH6671400.1 uncharacterized membrane protein YuzA (DUF378 family) [Paenibacillus sp. LBL]
MEFGGMSMFGIWSMLIIIVYGLFILLGLCALYLLIKLMMRAITALELYIDEKRNRRL